MFISYQTKGNTDRKDTDMSVSEFTISVHTADNSAPKSNEQETARDQQRELFRAWYGKYIIAIVTAFTTLLTFIYSVFAATRIEYLPSAIILMVTIGIISYLLEKDGERNE